MNIFPEDKKKTVIYTSLGLVCIGGIIYFIFFFGNPDTEVPVESGLAGSETGAVRQSAIMPYGVKFDTSVLEQEKFKSLRSLPQIEVRSEDLGLENPFSR